MPMNVFNAYDCGKFRKSCIKDYSICDTFDIKSVLTDVKMPRNSYLKLRLSWQVLVLHFDQSINS
jgi:hypothetical protein